MLLGRLRGVDLIISVKKFSQKAASPSSHYLWRRMDYFKSHLMYASLFHVDESDPQTAYRSDQPFFAVLTNITNKHVNRSIVCSRKMFCFNGFNIKTLHITMACECYFQACTPTPNGPDVLQAICSDDTMRTVKFNFKSLISCKHNCHLLKNYICVLPRPRNFYSFPLVYCAIVSTQPLLRT